jgi:hypothetical protein
MVTHSRLDRPAGSTGGCEAQPSAAGLPGQDAGPAENHEYTSTWTEYAVRVVGEDAFMFTSRNYDEAQKWLAQLLRSGHDVELASCAVHSVIRTRRSPWRPVPTSPATPAG